MRRPRTTASAEARPPCRKDAASVAPAAARCGAAPACRAGLRQPTQPKAQRVHRIVSFLQHSKFLCWHRPSLREYHYTSVVAIRNPTELYWNA